ncbi:MAG: MaoC family dehydratase N-terminal domain-containing protein [Chloroflexi bacterium]|nr:MaoC family dehydratase N-terminal domain-containing protein [Chloroflexota bacterium]
MVMELEYDRSLYGKEHLAGPFEVTKELIQSFTRSVGETNPVFTDEDAARAAGYRGLVAPPTLCTVLVHRVSLPSINLKFGKMQVHAGQRVQPRAPIVAGDQLTASSHLKDVYAKTGRSGTMVFTVWETTFRNQNGEVVADVQESFATRE